jgi:hypothetical protein
MAAGSSQAVNSGSAPAVTVVTIRQKRMLDNRAKSVKARRLMPLLMAFLLQP